MCEQRVVLKLRASVMSYKFFYPSNEGLSATER